MIEAAVRERLARVRETIAAVCEAEGIGVPPRIVAVTKGHPAAAVQMALAVGLDDVGENRIQEAIGKQGELGDLPVRWHLIGHLQTNKARFVPHRFTLVHSVDSERLVTALARAMERPGADGEGSGPLDVLLQVNVAGETQKSGCGPDEADRLAAAIVQTGSLRLQGLMTMAPQTTDQRVQRRTFAALRGLRDRLAGAGYPVPELSMGMSGDYPAAVAEGATLLRLGTVLFGERR